MTSTSFNASTSGTSYSYQPHPFMTQAFLIMKREAGRPYEPVGEYTILDPREAADTSEKKVMNLVTLMNGRDSLIDLGESQSAHTLFHMVPRDSDSGKSKIIFYSWEPGGGVSTENAILTIAEDIAHD